MAGRAGVSLATVENIEGGRANPSLSTLTRVLASVGLSVAVQVDPVDWQALIALGLPLQGEGRDLPRRDAATLQAELGRAVLALDGATPRQAECVRALLLALCLHFPDVAERWFAAAPHVRAAVPASPTGREIKLYRIARARIAEYL